MIGVVIVTYNRLEKLKHSLNLFDSQTIKPDYIYVVNNHSNDGTYEFLNFWKEDQSEYKKYVYTTEQNLGGSGGFNIALAQACLLDSEWIWISDDDAFPEITTIEMAHKCIEQSKNQKMVALCGVVMNFGHVDTSHRKRIYTKGLKIVTETISEDSYTERFELNAFSYVGTIVRKSVLEKVGVTNKDYFIWYDDTEHSLRISKEGKIICFPEIVVHHDIMKEANDYNWKSYYGLRNKIDMYRRHFSAPVFVYTISKKIVMSLLYTFLPHSIMKADKEYIKIYKKALYDGIRGKLGIDDKYIPGWKPTIYK